MDNWVLYACAATLCWGVVGLLQKLGTNRVSARSLLVWLIVGFAALLPLLWRDGSITGLGWRVLLVGLLGGAANGLGSWALFEALERGAKASVAVPLTALYPLVTIVLARIFLAETLTFRQWIGIALAVAGGTMLSYETESAPRAVASEAPVK
jgi:transporter family protein